jgi:ABC-2 type transport system ATP-binding protein
MIEIIDLTKRYHKKKESIQALDHISLTVRDSEILGLIGMNGAGKTTTLKILSGLIIPDDGVVKINDVEVVNNKRCLRSGVGLLTGEFTRSLYWRLTGRQNLVFFANLRNMWNPDNRINELLRLFDLEQYADEQVMKYSTGMKHKLSLITGLLDDPQILLLDEPLTGIDPATAFMIKRIVREQFRGKTIIWASHNLYEVEEMCDRIALIHKGKILFVGTPNEIKKAYGWYTKIIVVCDKPDKFSLFQNAVVTGSTVTVQTDDVHSDIERIVRFAEDQGIRIQSIQTVQPSLEEIFMKVVNNAR